MSPVKHGPGFLTTTTAMSTLISRSLRVRQFSGRCLWREGIILQSSRWGQLRRLGTEAGVAPADEGSVPDEPYHFDRLRQSESNAYRPAPLSYLVDYNNHCVQIQNHKKGEQPHKFDFHYLRDACSCPKCVDSSTKQKNFQTSDIPENLVVKQLTMQENGDVQLEWQDDIPGFGPDHITTLPDNFFRRNWSRFTRVLSRYDDSQTIAWDKKRMEKDVGWFPYDSYMSSEATLLKALMHLHLYGLIFLSDVPSTEESVVNIGTRIGPLRDSFYGRTWDVKSVPDAKNVAYTHQHLGLHMDLLYMQNPPGLQLLHCLRATCAGGNSLFSDSYRAVYGMRKFHKAEFRALQNFPVTYHYHNAGQHYHFTRPTVELEPYRLSARARRFAAVNWAPPFQAPFEIDVCGVDNGEAFGAYLKAARRFAETVEAEDALFELKLEEGQCVVFNNRRVLHARRAFDIGEGERWLKGAYVDRDVFQSKLRVLREESGEPLPFLGEKESEVDFNSLRGMREDKVLIDTAGPGELERE